VSGGGGVMEKYKIIVKFDRETKKLHVSGRDAPAWLIYSIGKAVEKML